MTRPLATPALLLALAAAAAPACPQGSGGPGEAGGASGGGGSGGGAPARFSPEAVAARAAAAAGRPAIPQPGEGFPSALGFETVAPERVRFAAEGEVVAWEQAAGYLGGDVVTVQGRVADAFQVPGGPCLLRFDPDDKKAFYLAAFTRDWPQLAAPPAELYRGRVVRVTGPVTAYRGVPQIKVEHPTQIEIVGG